MSDLVREKWEITSIAEWLERRRRDDQPTRDDDADANAAIAIWNQRNG